MFHLFFRIFLSLSWIVRFFLLFEYILNLFFWIKQKMVFILFVFLSHFSQIVSDLQISHFFMCFIHFSMFFPRFFQFFFQLVFWIVFFFRILLIVFWVFLFFSPAWQCFNVCFRFFCFFFILFLFGVISLFYFYLFSFFDIFSKRFFSDVPFFRSLSIVSCFPGLFVIFSCVSPFLDVICF